MARILVVDDDRHVRTSIEAILDAEGHDVQLAAGGREALAAVDHALPDLIVLDLAMPETDGWRVLEELHLRGVRPHTRVLLVSGQYSPDVVSDRAPRDLFLPKPFDSERLIDAVEALLAVDPEDLYERRDRSGDLARLLERVEQALG